MTGLAFRALAITLRSGRADALTAVSSLAVAALAGEREVLVDRVLRASRTRIVVAADEERRRLERNLHDGAQQRLVALAARSRDGDQRRRTGQPAPAASLGAAQSEVLAALEDLRELVHGIRPAALRQFGLARAVEGVAARSSTPVELVELPELRLDETAEATAYYVVLEAVANAQRYAHASVIRVRGPAEWADPDAAGGGRRRRRRCRAGRSRPPGPEGSGGGHRRGLRGGERARLRHPDPCLDPGNPAPGRVPRRSTTVRA